MVPDWHLGKHHHRAGGGTLDDAYDFGGAGAGRTITADAGAVQILGDDGFVATGTMGVGAIPVTGPGARLMWYPNKAAFRAGSIDNNEWDQQFIGEYSASFGLNTIASGSSAIAIGYKTKASGAYSLAAGADTKATGHNSTALGSGSEASGWCSLASGGATPIASGDFSVAFGLGSHATGVGALAVGLGSIASGEYSAAFGIAAHASEKYSIAMGNEATASGKNSFASGKQTTASGMSSSAMGVGVSTNGKTGAFIIGDASGISSQTGYVLPADILNSVNDNSFTARFTGGYKMLNNASGGYVQLSPNGYSWQWVSDSTKKENIVLASGENVLEGFRRLRLGSWNFKGADPKVARHYGTIAQEWNREFGRDSFGLIGTDTTLESGDLMGIAYIAIQALEERTDSLRAFQINLTETSKLLDDAQEELASQEQELRALRREVEALRTVMAETKLQYERQLEVIRKEILSIVDEHQNAVRDEVPPTQSSDVK